MSNPFDQFDNVTPTAVADVPQSVVIKPGENPVAVEAAAQPVIDPNAAPNAFDNPTAQPERLTGDAFSSALYDKMNSGASADEILAWAESVGQKMDPGRNFYTNIKLRDQALARGEKPQYGRVNERKAKELTQPDDIVGSTGAFVRQGANTMLANFGDEIAAGGGALLDAVGGKGGLEENYLRRWNELQDVNDVDWKVDPGMSGAGTVVGALGAGAITPSISALQRVRQMNLAARAGIGAIEGGIWGGAAATGEGRPGDRFGNTAAGVGLGAGIGAAAEPLMSVAGRVMRPIIERVRPNEAKALADRVDLSPQQIADARAELARQQGLGVTDSTLLDVMPQQGRDVIGNAGVHPVAKEELDALANAREVQLPERVGTAADEIVAPAGIQGSADEVRTGIDQQRNAEIEAAMDAEVAPGITLRQTPLPMTPQIADVLGTTNGQKAIRDVINETTDPALRQQLQDLAGQTRARARAVDPRLSESAQQAVQGGTLESMPFSIDLSERISRKLGQLGRSTGNNAMFDFSRVVRDGANASPRFREIMDRYGQMSRSSDAVGVGSGVASQMDETGRIAKETSQGAGFMAEPAGRFEQRVGNLSDQPMKDATGQPLIVPTPGGADDLDFYHVTLSDNADAIRREGYRSDAGGIDGESVAAVKGMYGYRNIEDARAKAKELAAQYADFDLTPDDISIVRFRTPKSEVEPRLRADEDTGSTFDESWNGEGTGAIEGNLSPDYVDYVETATGKRSFQRGTPAPSDRDLARLGGAEQVRTQAGKGPAEARATASQLYDSPEQRRRSVALLGEEGADRLAGRMREEVTRAYRASRAAAKQGGSKEGAGAESAINVMYNPTSPVSWVRETARFLHRVGLSERDALWIVRNASDPTQTAALINRLEKAGMDKLKAQAQADILRDAAVRFFTQDDSQ